MQFSARLRRLGPMTRVVRGIVWLVLGLSICLSCGWLTLEALAAAANTIADLARLLLIWLASAVVLFPLLIGGGWAVIRFVQLSDWRRQQLAALGAGQDRLPRSCVPVQA